MKQYKGIILSGGTGSRLGSLTTGLSKQMLPIYDKPMIYYPLSVLMLAQIRDIAIITNPVHINTYKRMLAGFDSIGLNLTFIEQAHPKGLSHAYIIAEEFLNGDPSMMVLGDNIFYGSGLSGHIHNALNINEGANIFGYKVLDPERYGIAQVDQNHKVICIEEKPSQPKSNIAITGLYIFDGSAPERAAKIKPSDRGELEITDLIQTYLDEGNAEITILPRGVAWLDTGTPESLLEASQFVHTIQKRQGLYIACPEEIAYQNKWISKQQLQCVIDSLTALDYKNYLEKLLRSSETS